MAWVIGGILGLVALAGFFFIKQPNDEDEICLNCGYKFHQKR